MAQSVDRVVQELQSRLEMEGTLIMYTVFGSHLYGTSTSDSDQDYKGIYMPSKRQILTGNIPRSYSWTSKKTRAEGVKNTADDIDIEVYSLHYFIEMLLKGETAAMDMIHVRPDQCIISTPEWGLIHNNRWLAYTRSMSALIQYMRKQAAKYGIRGSRLEELEQVITQLKRNYETVKLGQVWDDLPVGDHVHDLGVDGRTGIRVYQVLGRKFQETMTIKNVLKPLIQIQEKYGERARLAKENKGIDWKAVSHALRAAIQMERMLSGAELTFPLPEGDLLTQVKVGELDYTTVVAPLLESFVDSVEWLASQSDFPEKAPREYWMSILATLTEERIMLAA